MTKENQKKAELISELIQEFLDAQEELERKAERNYYRRNISLEHLEATHVPLEKLATKKQKEVIDEMINGNDDYGLLEMVENEQLFAALKKLKEFDLSILNLRYKRNLYLKEIATDLEKGLSTICRRLDSALESIKDTIESENK